MRKVMKRHKGFVLTVDTHYILWKNKKAVSEFDKEDDALENFFNSSCCTHDEDTKNRTVVYYENIKYLIVNCGHGMVDLTDDSGKFMMSVPAKKVKFKKAEWHATAIS
jgi:hypothetical protein